MVGASPSDQGSTMLEWHFPDPNHNPAARRTGGTDLLYLQSRKWVFENKVAYFARLMGFWGNYIGGFRSGPDEVSLERPAGKRP